MMGWPRRECSCLRSSLSLLTASGQGALFSSTTGVNDAANRQTLSVREICLERSTITRQNSLVAW